MVIYMYSRHHKKVQYRNYSTALDSTSNSTAPIARQYRAISCGAVQCGTIGYSAVRCCVLYNVLSAVYTHCVSSFVIAARPHMSMKASMPLQRTQHLGAKAGLKLAVAWMFYLYVGSFAYIVSSVA